MEPGTPASPDKPCETAAAPTAHSPGRRRWAVDFLGRNWILVKFYSLFGILIGGFYLVSLHSGINEFFQLTYPSFVARQVCWLLNVVGIKSSVYSNQVHMPGFAFTIISGCTGIFAMMIYASAVLAYPAKAWSKALGVVMGVPCLMAVNVVRLVALGAIGVYHRKYFEYSHEYLWQGIFIILVIVLWMFWRWLLVDEDYFDPEPVEPDTTHGPDTQHASSAAA